MTPKANAGKSGRCLLQHLMYQVQNSVQTARLKSKKHTGHDSHNVLNVNRFVIDEIVCCPRQPQA